MPDEVSIFSKLGSWLYGSLIHAATVVGRSSEADITAIRVFEVSSGVLGSYVDTGRLCLNHQQDVSAQAWPIKPDSLFEFIQKEQMKDGIYRPDEIVQGWDSEGQRATEDSLGQSDAASLPWQASNRLFSGLGPRVVVKDCLCLSMPVQGDMWAVMALMRCEDSDSFDESHVQILKQIKPVLAHMLRSGCIRQGLTTSNVTARKRRTSIPRRWSTDEIIAKLTRTECQVLGYLRLAATEREISQEVHRSPHTVHVHVKNIYRKLDVSSRGELLELFGDPSRHSRADED